MNRRINPCPAPRFLARVLSGLWLGMLLGPAVANEHPGAEAFIQRAVSEYGLPAAQVSALLAEASFQQSIVDAISSPAESKPWFEYRKIFLNDQRIGEGVAFWMDNREVIARAAEEFGVDAQIIVAIIGVETLYGRITGSYRVIDALATLGFHYPAELENDRSEFFAGELIQFMLLGQEEGLPLTQVTGSYAGAMGMGQFIPSSYRSYAVDYDGNGSRDLWRSTPDAVASVANYLHRNGWLAGEPVARKAVASASADFDLLAETDFRPSMTVSDLTAAGFVSSPDLAPDRPAMVLRLEGENRPGYWLTFDNFHVITRYNRSPLYAMAVWQLSEAILAGLDAS
jgi:membrane-bound lytic murein transglycosylase B